MNLEGHVVTPFKVTVGKFEKVYVGGVVQSEANLSVDVISSIKSVVWLSF